MLWSCYRNIYQLYIPYDYNNVVPTSEVSISCGEDGNTAFYRLGYPDCCHFYVAKWYFISGERLKCQFQAFYLFPLWKDNEYILHSSQI